MNNTKHHYVYKYVYDSRIVYIGRCDNRPVERRIKEHAREKKFIDYCEKNNFKYDEFEIYFTVFPSLVEERIAETMLINKYKPILNSVDKVETDYTCINAEIKQDWIKFEFGNNVVKCSKPKAEYGQRLIRSRQGEKELLDMMNSAVTIVPLIEYLNSIPENDKRVKIPAQEVPHNDDGYYANFLFRGIKYSDHCGFVVAAALVCTWTDDYVIFIRPLCDCKKFIPLLEKEYLELKKKIFNFKGYKDDYRFEKHKFIERFFSKKDSGEWNEDNVLCDIKSYGDVAQGVEFLCGGK